MLQDLFEAADWESCWAIKFLYSVLNMFLWRIRSINQKAFFLNAFLFHLT